MQTPKTRNGSNGEIPPKASPAGTPRTSGATSARASSEKSPKVSERRSPRSPAKEKKRPSKIAELESQLSHAKEELKKAKEDLTSSETRHAKAAQEAEQQIAALTARLDESQRQLADLSAAEESRLQELKQISQERDKAWQSELETMQNQHSTDLTEIQILKQQIETLTESEKSQAKLYQEAQTELQVLKTELESQVQTNESLKNQLNEIQKSEIETKEISEERQKQLELAKQAIEKLEASICQKATQLEASSDENLGLRAEIEKLRLDLEEKTDNGSDSNLKIQTMNEWEEKVYELEFEVQNKNAELDTLKKLLEEKEVPKPESESELTGQLRSLKEDNETLKKEIREVESRGLKKLENVMSDLEIAKAAEQDVKMRLSYVTEEADKSSRRAARVAEQLDAAQAVTSEMESELKRLRIQSDQWRKAAEAAAAALTGPNSNNGRLMERTGSLDADYNSIAGKMMNSPFSDDLEFESPKKKSGGVLRRMSGLWKKSPK
ncbi:hypothetical protein LUZ60_003792 [Juncus effusus]|nr:hypothetical protein LUZ60_003792 [Juncus effusus]